MAKKYSKEQIQSVIGTNDQCVMGRLTKGVDLFEGIIQACEEHGIKTASFQCIGSLSQVGFVQIALNEEKEIGYSDPIYLESPVELLAGTGFIGLDADGELDIHYHGLFVDSKGTISGGHFLRGENPTAVTIEYVIQPTNDIHLQRNIDPVWNLPVFQFTERS
ncbi:PPC domain-containing DNA-binding protein [Ornithinibacillus salinisoli]|uniref:PPC domain-containing DNA-binding protein n=1 Tax=Ornithinibacillus salinisoli TaxID=1848459 RepID=A0ABW4W2P9_9BACI